MGYTEKVVIIGAGISGLACAFRLKQLGMRCVVLEATDRPGGLIATIRRDGFLFESGPQCPRFPFSVWSLVRDLNLESEFVAGDAKAKRYIFRAGTLHAAPFSPKGLIGTSLLGLTSKLRILTEVFRSSHPPSDEESLADFVERKFGTEVLDYLVDPLISTIFFADPHRMGMQSAFPALVEWERSSGSLVRGAIRARKSGQKSEHPHVAVTAARSNVHGNSFRVTDALPTLGSFRSGMGRLPERLADALRAEIRYGDRATSVEKAHGGQNGAGPRWLVHHSTGEAITARDLILAVPAYVAAQLLTEAVPELALQLNAIEYAPLHVVSHAYNRSQIANPLRGFGFMVPGREGLRTICTFWNSSLFPLRAPQDKVLITSFTAGGMPGEVHTADNGELAQAVEVENAEILGIRGSPVNRGCWGSSRAMPQYNIGHAQRVAHIQRILEAAPGLYVSSNFLKGRSIGDCVDLAFRIAENCVAVSHISTSNV